MPQVLMPRRSCRLRKPSPELQWCGALGVLLLDHLAWVDPMPVSSASPGLRNGISD